MSCTLPASVLLLSKDQIEPVIQPEVTVNTQAKILIVDDDMMELNLLCARIPSCGFTYDTAIGCSMRILMTGYDDLQAAINAINRGGVHRFITKPRDDTELRQVVFDAIDKYIIISSIKSADEAKLLSLA
jgi:hypothetical protein